MWKQMDFSQTFEPQGTNVGDDNDNITFEFTTWKFDNDNEI